jgi:LmbE family N-acetylglucosaminyl deacetylase
MKFAAVNRLIIGITVTLLLCAGATAEVPGKTLLIVAHPDDEYYFAATVYRMAVQLGGTVDELVITNGEGGFRYSALAEPYYGKRLTEEAIGRAELPAIRRQETLNAGRILGIRNHYYLDQKDEKFTTDINEGLNRLWDSTFILNTISDLIRGEHYRYVMTVLPRSTTHGHHQAATVLATRAIRSLPEEIRPVQLAADTDTAEYLPLPAFVETQVWPAAPTFAFDRNTSFGFNNSLSYQIVVSWMISEHKSQGLLQTMHNKDPKEYFWVDLANSPGAGASASELFRLLAPLPAVTAAAHR